MDHVSPLNDNNQMMDTISRLRLVEDQRDPRDMHKLTKVHRSRSISEERPKQHSLQLHSDYNIDGSDGSSSLKRRKSADDIRDHPRKQLKPKAMETSKAFKINAPAKIECSDSIETYDRFSPIKKPKIPTPEPTPNTDEPVKKRRGRPRKHEQVVREMKVTRKSLRISDKPELVQCAAVTVAPLTGPKPLKALDFNQLLSPSDTSDSSQSPGVPTFNPLISEAAKLSASASNVSRGPGVHINTLSVLLEYIKEHSPRSKANEIVNEKVILEEYKNNLVRLVENLLATHTSIVDISAQISEAHRKKNEIRKKILKVKDAHSALSSETESVRQELEDSKKKHGEFMSLVQSLEELKKCVNDDDPAICLDSTVTTKLNTYNRVFDSQWGLKARLQSVNSSLVSMLHDLEDNE